MILIHPHALANLMTNPKSGKDSDLSAGAITYCYELAKQEVYGYEKQISSKYLDKGLIVEDQSIQLYNNVKFTDFSKNTERKKNAWLTGECDIYVPGVKTIDIKSAWSIDTFPATADKAHDTGYEWQGRGYMMLWDVPEHEVAYCLVNTPDELIGYEAEELHNVDHIPEELRVTTITYKRCPEKEKLIKVKVEAARAKIAEFIQQIVQEHAA